MERENKKRGREEESEGSVLRLKKKREEEEQKKKKQEDDSDIFELLEWESEETYRPLAVFEFPWQKQQGGLVSLESYGGWDFRDVFFSSLVDGCSAKIGFPGDRLCRYPAAISFLSENDREGEEIELDGLDCIWSSVLLQPLSAGSTSKVPTA